MVKHIIILISLAFICFWGKANGKEGLRFYDDNLSPAVRNSLKFDIDLTDGNLVNDSEVSEDFNIPMLRSNWASRMGNDNWSLKIRPGYLRLKAHSVLSREEIEVEGTFAQKIEQNSVGEAVILVDLTTMGENIYAGLFCNTLRNNFVGIGVDNDQKKLLATIDEKKYIGPVLNEQSVLLKLKFTSTCAWFEYSFDGISYSKIGESFQLKSSADRPNLVGIYCIGEQNEQNTVDFDWFYIKSRVDRSVRFAENLNKKLIPEFL